MSSHICEVLTDLPSKLDSWIVLLKTSPKLAEALHGPSELPEWLHKMSIDLFSACVSN